MGSRKNILVFNAGPIFPIYGMNQVRVYNQIMRLSKDHKVDFMFLYTEEDSKNLTQEKLSGYCNGIIPVKTLTQSVFYRGVKKVILNWVFDKIYYPLDYYSYSNAVSSRLIIKKISVYKYDVIISHYWQASGFLSNMSSGIFKCIDTHYLVEENLDLYEKGMYKHFDNGRLEKLLAKELSLQKSCLDNADLIIVNSQKQADILSSKGYFNVLCIPNGQDLGPFLEYQRDNHMDNKYLLFYGALSNQFNQKALRRIIDGILPGVKKAHPDVKLIIMGSSPPEWLKEIAAIDSAIEVIGYMEDVRPIFAGCFASIIPLDSGSGFRGRAVELLASGVPIVGTTNALQSVQIQHKINGFIADTDKDIIHWLVRLADDKYLRDKISNSGRIHANKYYSLETTFGKLSEWFKEYKEDNTDIS
jgi:polysaccharide biosynthesis protein PslH